MENARSCPTTSIEKDQDVIAPIPQPCKSSSLEKFFQTLLAVLWNLDLLLSSHLRSSCNHMKYGTPVSSLDATRKKYSTLCSGLLIRIPRINEQRKRSRDSLKIMANGVGEVPIH